MPPEENPPRAGHRHRVRRLRPPRLKGLSINNMLPNMLTMLNLEGTRVTDAGLKHLTGFPALRNVNLKGTAVTPAGVVALRQQRPGLQVGGF